jgi:cobalt-zinc-cadmium efflux system outer membrane protein
MVVSIEDAVQEALDHNLVLLAERYSLSIAEARLTTARLRPNPVVSAGLDYQDVLGAGFFRDPTKGAGPSEYNARIDYLFEGGGKRGRRIEAAGAAKKVAELQLLDSTRQVVLDVQNAVVDYLLAKDNLSVARESLAALNETARLNEVRVKNGDLAQVEFLRSSVAALLFQNQVRQAQLLVYSTRNRLQLLLGRRVRFEGFDVKGTLRADHELLVLEGLRRFALDHRPDLEALRRDQARSLAEVKSQITQGKIDYTVGVQFHHQYGYANAKSLGFFFQTPLPIFNRNQGEIARAETEQQQISRRIQALELQIGIEVENAYQQYLTARLALQNIEGEMLAEARKVNDIMGFSYRYGAASLLDLLDSQRALNETLQTYNQTRADYARNLYALDSVTGKAVNP